MSDVKLRNFRPGDESSFLQLQSTVFRGIEYLPRVKLVIPALVPEGSYIAEKDGAVVGAIGLIKLEPEDWYEIRNLAVLGPRPEELASQLLKKSLGYLRSKNPKFVKSFTPAVQPFVDLYKQEGFEPARRSVRIRWDFPDTLTTEDHTDVETRLLSKEFADEAANVWVEGLRPYWDWWIQQEGGPTELKDWVRGSVGKDPGWIGAFQQGKLVGLSILRTDAYGLGEARFNGAYALPSHRGRGVGSALMKATIREAVRSNQRTMRVYTMAYLDHLAPGAVLYLKSNGRIEAEYLQLEQK